jgi:hypothetical protein
MLELEIMKKQNKIQHIDLLKKYNDPLPMTRFLSFLSIMKAGGLAP